MLLPGLLAPVILITLITAEQFELPLIIGLPAKINVFSYRIYFELNPLGSLPNYGGAAALSLPFVVFAMLLLLLYNRVIRRADRFVTVTGKAYRQRRLPLGAWRVPALAFVVLYIALAAVLPAAVLIWTSFFGYVLPLTRRSPTSASPPTSSSSPIARSGPGCATRCWSPLSRR